MCAFTRFSRRLTALAAFAVTRVAVAACANPCELTVEPPAVEPEIPCATIGALEQTCDCSVLFEVVNGCTTAIEALDFEFGLCWGAGNSQKPCSVLAPGLRASLFLKLDTVGSKRWTLHLSEGDVEHEVQLAASVSSIGDDGCGCVTAPRRRHTGWVSAYQLLALATGLLYRRRR